MEFISKISFYVMFGISILVALFHFANAVYIPITAGGKGSESIILALAGIVACTGMYFAYQAVGTEVKYLSACGILGLCWLVMALELFIGFLFFNGPIHWQ
ncbi:MAG: hypothetical protein IPN29_06770 [Saprospiraceae bacterium]|nr:hypothetical protein [Saprospiraceae bacterium]